jgi:hypothetical protein
MSRIRSQASTLALAFVLAPVGVAAVWAAEPAPPAAEAPAKADPAVDLGKVASDEAIELDVLAVVSLPIAADDAREAGIAADDVADVIAAVVDVGASPAVATDVLVAEAEQVRKRGAKPNFAPWVRGQLASGAASQLLVTKIEKAEAEYIELSAAERAEQGAKIAKLHDEAVERRKLEWLKVSKLAAAGKQLRVAGQDKLGQLRARVEKSVARQQRINAAIAADPEKRAAIERLVARVEKVVDKAGRAIDKAQDSAEKAADTADKAQDKADKAHDKAQELADKAQAKADKAQEKADKAKHPSTEKPE